MGNSAFISRLKPFACLLVGAFLAFAARGVAAAQSLEGCRLGPVKERVAPSYPTALNGRIVEGTVSVVATFAPDGHVTSSKAISGPAPLQFEARAYLNGWRASPAAEPRQCLIQIDFRFDGSQGVCSRRTDVNVRAERLDDTRVLLHLSCGLW